MKASPPPRRTRGFQPQTRKKTRAHSAFIYKAHKQVSPVGMRSPDFLGSRFGFPRPVLLRLVSSEASRLSRTNRAKVLTAREVNAAVTLVRQKIHSRAAA